MSLFIFCIRPHVIASVLELLIDCSCIRKSVLFLAMFWVAGIFSISCNLSVNSSIFFVTWGFLHFIPALPCPNLGLISEPFLT